MSSRFLTLFIISLTCIISTACTSTTPTPAPTSPIDRSGWETRLPGTQGSVTITFTLPRQAIAEFQFFNGKASDSNAAIVRVVLRDENCTSGHQAALYYKKTRSEQYTEYFTKEATWGKTNTITLAWNSDNQTVTTLNNEVVKAEIIERINTLKIVSYLAPIEIQKIEYLPQ